MAESATRTQARQSLPPNLHDAYESLVEDYRFACEQRYARAWVNYQVLADLIRVGWRWKPELD